MFSKLCWNQFSQNKLLVSGEHLYDEKVVKKQFYYEVWSPNQNKKSKKKPTRWVKVKKANIELLNLEPFISLKPSFWFSFYRWFKTCHKTIANTKGTATQLLKEQTNYCVYTNN